MCEYTVISNTCLGWEIMKLCNIQPYNNPFIGTLIYDSDYIKLVNNVNYYSHATPVLISEPLRRYNHRSIRNDYPVIVLHDIEIHCIHEKNINECLEKFIRRNTRLINLLSNPNGKIIITYSFSEFLEEHENISDFIDNYFENIDNDSQIVKLMIGPSKYYKESYLANYRPVFEWDNLELTRDTSGVYKFNNQDWSASKFYEFFENNKFI
jgi:uncharacterized protein (DUF1919 family)